jgi:type IV pilus assembly protein PilV
MKHAADRSSSRRRLVKGFALVEALVAIVIFAVGILGVMGLQANMIKATSAAKYRADASYLASELVGMMWGDVTNLAKYDSSLCGTYARCSGWSAKVASSLPSGSAAVTVNNGIVTVTVSWTLPGVGTNAFATSTAIRI